jgi:hypothetical protein
MDVVVDTDILSTLAKINKLKLLSTFEALAAEDDVCGQLSHRT